MNRFSRIVVAFALIALMAAPALAQRRPRQGRGGGGMPGLMLLGQKSVQEELKLSDDQVKELKEAGEKMRKEFQGLGELSEEERGKKFRELAKEGEKTVAKILDKKQAKRLKQISLQVSMRFQGSGVYSNPEVAKALNLTDDQKKEMATIQKDTREEMGKIFQGEGTREEKREKATEVQKSAKEKTDKLLTDDQKTKWKELIGEPFKGKIEFRPRGRGGRGRDR